MKRVAEQLNIGVESLRSWVHQYEIDHGERAGTSSVEADELKALKQRRSRDPMRDLRAELKRLKQSLRDDWKAWSRLCGTVLDASPA